MAIGGNGDSYPGTGPEQGGGKAETLAVWCLTKVGAQLGRVLAAQLGGRLLAPRPLAEEFGAEAFSGIVGAVRARFHDYRNHVFVAASGIVVRAIGPILKGKDKDPAVVVVDQRGRYCVSLVSGHLGGANELSRRVASATAGQSVVTTATDVEDLPSIDDMARERGMALEGIRAVKAVSAAILAGDGAQLHDPDNHLGLAKARIDWAKLFTLVPRPENWIPGMPGVFVTWRAMEPARDMLVLHPPCLAVGVGCRRGIEAGAVTALVGDVLRDNGLAPGSVMGWASIDAKSDELGLMEAAAAMGKGLFFYDRDKLADIEVPNPSETVFKHMGVHSVCEAAATRLAGGGPLLVEKTARDGVTVAVALVP